MTSQWYALKIILAAPNIADFRQARELVLQSDGLEQTRALAQDYADKAIAAIHYFPASEAKDGLIEMVDKTLKRRK